MIVLVEIYLRLEDRLLTAGSKPLFVTDDVTPGSFVANLTRVNNQTLTLPQNRYCHAPSNGISYFLFQPENKNRNRICA